MVVKRIFQTFGVEPVETYIKLFLRQLKENENNLGVYIDSLFSEDNPKDNIIELFGELKREGYVNYLKADNRVYNVSLTLKAKNLTASDLKLSDREELQCLLNQISVIEKLFHKGEGEFSITEEIHDTPQFQEWIQQVVMYLQEIFDRTHDQFIWDVIHNKCKKKMNGWNDKSIFAEIVGALKSVEKNMDKYYSIDVNNENKNGEHVVQRTAKIFISHSSKDKEYVTELVNLFKEMGLKQNDIFCSSVPGYDIGLNENIFDTLRGMFQDNDLYMIFIHSRNYYSSPVSLNEMGAAWVVKTKHCSLLLPEFDFSDMKGVVTSNTISIKIDADRSEVKNRLNQLYDELAKFFGIERNNTIVWEQARDLFIDKMNAIEVHVDSELSEAAKAIVCNAEKDDKGMVLINKSLDGTIIQAGKISMNKVGVRREEAKMISALQELIRAGFLSQSDNKGEIYQLTNKAYSYIDAQ